MKAMSSDEVRRVDAGVTYDMQPPADSSEEFNIMWQEFVERRDEHFRNTEANFQEIRRLLVQLIAQDV